MWGVGRININMGGGNDFVETTRMKFLFHMD